MENVYQNSDCQLWIRKKTTGSSVISVQEVSISDFTQLIHKGKEYVFS